jgi:hypothetical protein
MYFRYIIPERRNTGDWRRCVNLYERRQERGGKGLSAILSPSGYIYVAQVQANFKVREPDTQRCAINFVGSTAIIDKES